MSQSGSFLALSLQDLTKDIQDPILRYFLKYLHYLDDLQTVVVAEEIVELQREVDLEDPDLNVQCQDYDCCKYEADLSPLPEDMWGGVTPQGEKRNTRHLLYHTVFGQKLFHNIVLRAATLETALIRALMPTKGATTSLQKHFQP